VVKKLAAASAKTAGNSKAKLSKEALDAIMQASDWFFEQVSEDLGAYAAHAGRKTIEESDVITLMTRFVWIIIYKDHHDLISYRQRQTNATTTPFSLAQKHLPRELLQELRMVPPSKYKTSRQLQRIEEEE
jgi:histone H3/H4